MTKIILVLLGLYFSDYLFANSNTCKIPDDHLVITDSDPIIYAPPLFVKLHHIKYKPSCVTVTFQLIESEARRDLRPANLKIYSSDDEKYGDALVNAVKKWRFDPALFETDIKYYTTEVFHREQAN